MFEKIRIIHNTRYKNLFTNSRPNNGIQRSCADPGGPDGVSFEMVKLYRISPGSKLDTLKICLDPRMKEGKSKTETEREKMYINIF